MKYKMYDLMLCIYIKINPNIINLCEKNCKLANKEKSDKLLKLL